MPNKFPERVQTLRAANSQAPSLHAVSIVKLAASALPAPAAEFIGSYFQDARLLG